MVSPVAVGGAQAQLDGKMLASPRDDGLTLGSHRLGGDVEGSSGCILGVESSQNARTWSLKVALLTPRCPSCDRTWEA